MMYKYLVIKPDKFSSMDEKKLFENIISRKSQRLRRPLNDINYNYLPIFCKGHCKKEADLFIPQIGKLLAYYESNYECYDNDLLRCNLVLLDKLI